MITAGTIVVALLGLAFCAIIWAKAAGLKEARADEDAQVDTVLARMV